MLKVLRNVGIVGVMMLVSAGTFALICYGSAYAVVISASQQISAPSTRGDLLASKKDLGNLKWI